MKKVSLEKHFIGISKDSLIYGMGNAVLRILALITAPIFTRVFIPAEYGVISLIASLISFVSLFLIFGMDNALFVSFYEHKKQKKLVASSAFWFLFIWGLALILIANLFVGTIAAKIFPGQNYEILFRIALWTAYLTLLINFAKIIFRLEFRSKTFAVISAINAIVVTGLMILFVVYFKKGLTGYFTGSLVGTAFTLIIALFCIKKNLLIQVSIKRLKEMLRFGVFVLPASLAFFVFDLSDRFFINHYRDLTELGLYSIGINIASLIVFFSFAFGQAWSPRVMDMYFTKRKIYNEFVPRFFAYHLIFFFSIAVAISIFSLEILKIFTTPKFYPASAVVGPLALAMVFSASNQITSLGITISKKTKYLALFTMMAAAVNIALNFLLIPKYGMVGAAIATALSYLFLTCIYFIKSQKLIPLKIDWQKIIKLVLLSLVAILLTPLTWKYSFQINLIVKIFEFGAYLTLLVLLDVIEKRDIQSLKLFFAKRRKK